MGGGTYKKKGVFSQMGDINTAVIGVPAPNVTTVDSISGNDIVTIITFTDLAVGTVAGANKAIGVLIYRFPAGAHVHIATYMSIALTIGDGADTPDVGIGSVIGVGAVTTLDGTATFEDYITGQTAAGAGGEVTVKTSVATAGALVGISVNEAAGTKTVHLNCADSWGNTGTVLATGTIKIKWVKMS